MSSRYDHINAALRWTVVVGLLIVSYVLSYAPVYRVCRDIGWDSMDDGLGIYRPVD